MRYATTVSAVSVLIAVASAAFPSSAVGHRAVASRVGSGFWPSSGQALAEAASGSRSEEASEPGTVGSGGSTGQSGRMRAVEPAVPCVGDGSTGARLQVLLVGGEDHFGDMVRDPSPAILSEVERATAQAADVFARTAEQRGGDQTVRVVTEDCGLAVDRVVLPDLAMETFAGMRTELMRRGYNRTDRAYLVFAVETHYCGVAAVKRDDSAGAGNTNNVGPVFARVDRNCWGLPHSVEAHELVHAFGGVQPGAPGATGDGHALDTGDRLAASGGAACRDEVGPLLDCMGDSYFHPNPAPGSYLATHWNVADSVFLASSRLQYAGTDLHE